MSTHQERKGTLDRNDDALLNEEEWLKFFHSDEGRNLYRSFIRCMAAYKISPQVAREAAEIVIVHVSGLIGQGRATRKMRTAGWLFKAAKWNAFRLHKKSQRCRPDHDACLDLPSPTAVFGKWQQYGADLLRDRREALVEAFRRLSAWDRLLIRLRYLEALPASEMASVFSVHPGNISRWINDALDRLRQECVSVLRRDGYDCND